MSDQVQCPNCGGYKIDGKILRVDPSTGQVIKYGGCFLVVITIMLYVGAVQCLWFLLFFLGEKIFSGVEINPAIGLLAIAATFVLPFFVVIPFYIERNAAKKRAYNLYVYHCNLCGYDWQWREGQPRPKVSVQPDLIEKGEQRLQEEDERRRKQQEAAAALYHLTHQNKK